MADEPARAAADREAACPASAGPPFPALLPAPLPALPFYQPVLDPCRVRVVANSRPRAASAAVGPSSDLLASLPSCPRSLGAASMIPQANTR